MIGLLYTYLMGATGAVLTVVGLLMGYWLRPVPRADQSKSRS